MFILLYRSSLTRLANALCLAQARSNGFITVGIVSIYTIFPTLDPMHTDDDGTRGRASDGGTGPSLDDITRESLLTTPSSVARDDLANPRGVQHDEESTNSLEFSPDSNTIDQSGREPSQYPALEQPASSAGYEPPASAGAPTLQSGNGMNDDDDVY